MKTTYSGSCHYQKVRFEVDMKLTEVRVCDCTICTKRGALICRVDPVDFRLLTPLEDMVLYQCTPEPRKTISAPSVASCRFDAPVAPRMFGP